MLRLLISYLNNQLLFISDMYANAKFKKKRGPDGFGLYGKEILNFSVITVMLQFVRKEMTDAFLQ